jgi:hypothetical protein
LYVQALRLCTDRTAHRGSRGIVLPFHDHGTRRGWGISVTSRPLFTPGKTRYPLYRRLCGSQGRSGQVRKISPPPGFDPQTVQPVASRYTVYATRPTLDMWWALFVCKITLLVPVEIWWELIKSSLFYDSETRRLTENNKRRVEATEMDVLRRSSRISGKERIKNITIRKQIGL